MWYGVDNTTCINIKEPPLHDFILTKYDTLSISFADLIILLIRMLHHAVSHTDAVKISRKTSLYNYAIVAFAAIGSVIYGYDSSVIATTLVCFITLHYHKPEFFFPSTLVCWNLTVN